MADKTVTYRLLADITQFRASMAQAAASVGATADRMTAATKEGKSFRAGLTTVGSAAGKIGLVAAAGLGAAIAAAANFDQAMSRVQGATQDSAKQMEALRTAAINAGRDTVFSASEAASAEEEMAKAGVRTKDILSGGLTGALNLASAGTIGVGQAAEIAATTMNQFGLAGTQVTHIADVLAATAGKAQGEVTDMAEALKFVGPVASQMGVSLEQTAGSIGYLASQGILGSQAGTSLRGILTALTSPSKAAAKEMKTLGISMYDAKGNFVGLDGIAGQLHDKMSGLSNATRDQALGQIFGNQQITAARILYAGGAQAVDQWTKKVNDSGYAARLAATKMNNLKGDLEQLKGSLETALIGTGEGAQGPLRSLVQHLTSAVNAYSDLGSGAKQGVGEALAATALLGGSVYVFSRLVTGVAATRAALTELGASASTAGLALKGMIAVGVVVGLDKLAGELVQAKNSAHDLRQELQLMALGVQASPNLDFGFKNLGQEIREAAQEQAIFSSGFGKSLLNLAPDFTKTSDNIAQVDRQLAKLARTDPKAAASAFASIKDQARQAGVSMEALANLFPKVMSILGQGKRAKASIIDEGALLNGLTKLRDYRSQLMHLPQAVLTKVASPQLLTTTKQVEALGKQYKNLDAHDIRVIMRARDFASPEIQKVLKALHLLDQQHPKPKLDADPSAAHGHWRTTMGELSELGHQHPMATLDANFHPAASAIQDALHTLGIYGHQRATATLDANPVPALASIARTQQAINSLHGTTVTNYVNTVHRGGSQLPQADGGIVDYYATGGIREHHVAQIAPAGAMRIWAEPETGGEAYIPLAPAKRDRSRAIAAEVVSRLGGHVQFANGGVVGGSVIQAGPVEIRGVVDIPGIGKGNLVGTMRAVARHEVQSAADRTAKGAYANRRT